MGIQYSKDSNFLRVGIIAILIPADGIIQDTGSTKFDYVDRILVWLESQYHVNLFGHCDPLSGSIL